MLCHDSHHAHNGSSIFNHLCFHHATCLRLPTPLGLHLFPILPLHVSSDPKDTSLFLLHLQPEETILHTPTSPKINEPVTSLLQSAKRHAPDSTTLPTTANDTARRFPHRARANCCELCFCDVFASYLLLSYITRTNACNNQTKMARIRSAAVAWLQPTLAGHGERRWLGTAAAEAGVARWEPMVAREYYDYRRAIYGDITHKAILVDTVGTLLAPSSPWPRQRKLELPRKSRRKERMMEETEPEKHKTMVSLPMLLHWRRFKVWILSTRAKTCILTAIPLVWRATATATIQRTTPWSIPAAATSATSQS